TLDDDLQAALEAAGIGAFRWDKQTSRFSASPALEAMLAEMCGSFDGSLEGFLACVHAEDRAAAAQAFASAVEACDDYHAEIRALRMDGGVRSLIVHGRAVMDEAGEPTGMTGIIQDVTAARDAEGAIRRSEARFRSLVLATSQTVWITGPDG